MPVGGTMQLSNLPDQAQRGEPVGTPGAAPRGPNPRREIPPAILAMTVDGETRRATTITLVLVPCRVPGSRTEETSHMPPVVALLVSGINTRTTITLRAGIRTTRTATAASLAVPVLVRSMSALSTGLQGKVHLQEMAGTVGGMEMGRTVATRLHQLVIGTTEMEVTLLEGHLREMAAMGGTTTVDTMPLEAHQPGVGRVQAAEMEDGMVLLAPLNNSGRPIRPAVVDGAVQISTKAEAMAGTDTRRRE